MRQHPGYEVILWDLVEKIISVTAAHFHAGEKLVDSKTTPVIPSRGAMLRSVLLGGVLPVVAFSVVEELYGATAGLIAGMVFGVGEIIYERVRLSKVSAITWIGNLLLLVLGGVSLISADGIWFKMQPAIIEWAAGLGLLGSVLAGRPLLILMAEKQLPPGFLTPETRPVFAAKMRGLTWRFGVFFLLHAALATWAACKWSTAAWALLKGGGFTGSMIVYVGVEMLWMRRGRVPKGQSESAS